LQALAGLRSAGRRRFATAGRSRDFIGTAVNPRVCRSEIPPKAVFGSD
jgi:hypothetical protein